MRSASPRLNPFTMMMNPEAILAAMERSERLQGLQRRVCRPLDRPLIPKLKAADLAAFDNEIDDEELDADDASA
jgi:hypothetical protein